MQIIGIDPDLEKSGIGFVEDGKVVQLQALNFFQLQQLIDERKASALFVLEDVELNKALYSKHMGKNARVRERISQNVGQVKAVARLIEQYLIHAGAKFKKVPPLKGQIKAAKTSSSYFNQITGWEGSSSADKRDAALLALYGVACRRTKKVLPSP